MPKKKRNKKRNALNGQTQARHFPVDLAAMMKSEPLAYASPNGRNTDEMLEMQEKTFRKWINTQMERSHHSPINNLFQDLQDGITLLRLIEALHGVRLPREKGKSRVYAVNNISQVLQFYHGRKVQLIGVNAADIADGNPKITLGLVWKMILHHWKAYAEEAATSYKEMQLNDVLKRWCHYSTLDYSDVSVKNFTSCWADGLAFNAILHKYNNETFDFNDVRSLDPCDRLDFAFQFAHEHLGIAKLLEPSDFANPGLMDSKSIMTYLLTLFQCLPHDQLSAEVPEFRDKSPSPISQKSQVGGGDSDGGGSMKTDKSGGSEPSVTSSSQKVLARARGSGGSATSSPALSHKVTAAISGRKRKTSAISSSELLKDYQSCLEEVLAWLLDAEEGLNIMAPVSDTDLEVVKTQFKEHEEMMVTLTQSQDSVGGALQRGQLLIHSGRLTDEEKLAVHQQLTLVNDKWESLRQAAMRRQTLLQERLMKLQQQQLDGMQQWLIDMETLIANCEPPSADPDVAKTQANEHKETQERIESQQKVILRLSSFVAVVDDQSEDSDQREAYQLLERSLQNIGQRWMTICQWAERRAQRLDGLSEMLQQLALQQHHLTGWLDRKQQDLSTMLKSAHHLDTQQEITEQIDHLRAFESELEAEHPSFVLLSRVTSEASAKLEFDNPSAAFQMRRQFDSITQQWDNLVVRIEEHSQTLVRSGKVDSSEFQSVQQPPVESTKAPSAAQQEVQTAVLNIAPESTEIFQSVTSSTDSSALFSSEPSNASTVIESSSPLTEQISVEHRSIATGEPSTEMPQSGSEVSPAVVKEIPVEKEPKTDELVQPAHSTEKTEAELAFERKEIKDELAIFYAHLDGVDSVVNELSEWLTGFHPEHIAEVEQIRLALAQCQNRLELVRAEEPHVTQLQTTLEMLLGRPHITDAKNREQMTSAQQAFDRFTVKWANVVDRISETLETLTTNLETAPDASVRDAFDALYEWIDGAEQILQMDQLEKIDNADITAAKIDRLRELDRQRAVHVDSYLLLESLTTEDASKVQLRAEMVQLKARWENVGQSMKRITEGLELGWDRQKQWDACQRDADSALDQLIRPLHDGEQPAYGNPQRLRYQLEQTKVAEDGISSVGSKLEQMRDLSGKLNAESSPTVALSEHMHQRLEEITRRWTDAKQLSKAKMDSLSEALERDEKARSDLTALTTWMDSVDTQLGDICAPSSDGEQLGWGANRLNDLIDQLHNQQTSLVNSVDNFTEVLAVATADDDVNHVEVLKLKQDVQAAKQRFSALEATLNEKAMTMSDAFENWKEFQELVATEKDSLNRLERMLNETSLSATDAEEFSEQLDQLEGLMDVGGQNAARIQSLATRLDSKKLLDKNAITDAVDETEARRSKLAAPAEERKQQLERGVKESQEFERQLINCQSWIQQVDRILSSRLEADIVASDLPDDYKQLNSEFVEYESCISGLARHVEKRRLASGDKAVQRLHQQLSHLQSQFGDARQKFDEFKRPREFEQKLERSQRAIKDLANTMERNLAKPNATTVGQIDALVDVCKECECSAVQVAEEARAIGDSGRRLTTEGMLNDASTDSLLSLDNQQQDLLNQVSEAQARLQSAQSLIGVYEKESEEVTSFLDEAERDLDSWEVVNRHDIDAGTNLEQQFDFIKRIKRELPRRDGGWATLEKTVGDCRRVPLADAAVDVITEQLHQLRARWTALTHKLDKWNEFLKNLSKGEEALSTELNNSRLALEVKVNEGEERIATIKHQIDQGDYAPSDIRPQIQAVVDASVEWRSETEQLNDKLQELASRKDVLTTADEIRPRIQQLSERCDAMTETLTDMQRVVEVTSLTSCPLSPSSPTTAVVGRSPPLLLVHAPSETSLESLVYEPDLNEKIESVDTALCSALDQLDFTRSPPKSVSGWEYRVQSAKQFMEESSEALTNVIAAGRRLANSGPMEHHIQNTLEAIDQLHSRADNVESKIESQERALEPILKRHSELMQNIDGLQWWFTQAKSADLTKPAVLQATQDEVLERQAELERLRQEHEQLETQIPGISSSTSAANQESPFTGVEQDSKTVDELIKRAQSEMERKTEEAARTVSKGSDEAGQNLTVAAEVHAIREPPLTKTSEASESSMPTSTLSSELSETPPSSSTAAAPTADTADTRTALERQMAAMKSVQMSVNTAQSITQLEQSLKEIEKKLLLDREKEALGGAGGAFGAFSQQEDSLKAVGENLKAASTLLEHQRKELENVPKGSDKDRLDLLLASAQTRVARLDDLYQERTSALERRLATWQQLQGDLHSLSAFVDTTEQTLNDVRQKAYRLELDAVEQYQLSIEDGIKERLPLLEKISFGANKVLPMISGPDAQVIREKLDNLSKRWHGVSAQVAERRERLEERQAESGELREEVDELLFWCDETESLFVTAVDPSSRSGVADLLLRITERHDELPEKLKRLKAVERSKDKFLTLKLVPISAKQQMRRDIAEVQTRLIKVRPVLDQRRKLLERRMGRCGEFWRQLDALAMWTRKAREMLEEFHSATIYTPTRFDPVQLSAELKGKQMEVDAVSRSMAAMREEARLETDTGDVDGDTLQAFDRFLADWSVVRGMAAAVEQADAVGSPADISTRSGDSILSDYTEDKTPSSVTSPTAVIGTMPSTSGDDEIYSPIVKKFAQRAEPVDAAGDHLGPQVGLGPKELLIVEIEEVPVSRAFPQLSPKSRDQMKELVQLRHWLADSQRDASGAVNVVDYDAIKDAIRTLQIFLDQLQTKRLELIRILEDARAPEVQSKAEIVSHEWERVVASSTKRKKVLTAMLDEARLWDRLKATVDMWLQEGNEKATLGPKVHECTIEQLKVEIGGLSAFFSTLDEYKQKMVDLNQRGNRLMDGYPYDDSTSLNHLLSEVNTLWSKFNDNIRIRRAVLEAALRSRKDFQTALGELEQWLTRVGAVCSQLAVDTDNPQLVKDSQKRKGWIDNEKELRLELEAHGDVINSMRDMGAKLAESGDGVEKGGLVRRIDAVHRDYTSIVDATNHVRQRLEAAQEQWERLTIELKELIYWTDGRCQALLDQQPVGGDLKLVDDQCRFVKDLLREMDGRESDVKEVIRTARSFLMQQDLRPRYPVGGVHGDEQAEPEDEEKRATRRVTYQIKVECDALEERWKGLREKGSKWNTILKDIHLKMGEFDQTIQDCDLQLLKVENMRRAWKPVPDVQLDDLPNQMHRAKTFRVQLASARVAVDDVNDRSSRLLADNVELSLDAAKTLESLNGRYKRLETAIQLRMSALDNALKDFGPSSQHFLIDSAQKPWERAISVNRLPYYINHTTEATQWDHPKMADVVNKLCEFNDVKFAAYRTGIKLRALQKKLCLDLLRLEDIELVLDRQNLVNCNDRLMDVADLVMALLPLFEGAQLRFPALVANLPLAIDLCLNYILNLYDPARSGGIRVLSFKIGVSLLCDASLEDKYKFLYKQVSPTGVGLDQKKLALMLYDCIHIPKFLGEVAAFGGSNVEPSVRSCFERVKFPHEVSLEDYLEWLKLEPQSLVWLPVMHRIAAAENAKHQAKCNVCKMFPILGLRYRCLKCFNFDMCQNCFFCQRIAKGHKLFHPMKEYCVATTSGEDVRDFGKVMRNKLKGSRVLARHAKMGYLPVQTVAEGSPIESRSTVPSNALTQHLHGRIENFASRLSEDDIRTCDDTKGSSGKMVTLGDSTIIKEDSGSEHAAIKQLLSGSSEEVRRPTANGAVVGVLKSPAQIVSQIDHVQKEELDQILHQLEDENRQLQLEFDQLRGGETFGIGAQSAHNATQSTPHLITNGSVARSTAAKHASQGQLPPSNLHQRSVGSLPRNGEFGSSKGAIHYAFQSEEEMLREAKALRLHKQKLEERINVLEEHNDQLAVQLDRLKQLTEEQRGMLPLNLDGLVTLTESGMAAATPPSFTSPQNTLTRNGLRPLTAPQPGDETDVSVDQTGSRIEVLMSTAQDLGRAMGSFVTAVTSDDDEDYDDERFS